MSAVFSWAEISAVLLATCQLVTSDDPQPEIDAYQHHESNVFISPDLQARLVLRVTRSRENGSDRRWADDATETNIVWTQLTVQILCESEGTKDGEQALTFLENLRARFRRSHVLDELDAVGASVLSVGDSVASSGTTDEGREVDTRAFDLELSCVLNDTDASTAGNWVQTIGLAGQIEGGVTPLAFGASPTTEVEIS